MSSLQQQFPQFPFVRAADEWFLWSKGKNMAEQLRDRRVSQVCIASIISAGGLGIAADGKFFILLNDFNRPEENAEEIGHEIGHTFHFDLSSIPPVDLLGFSAGHEEAVEDFCRAFSEEWLREVGGSEPMVRCLDCDALSLLNLELSKNKI